MKKFVSEEMLMSSMKVSRVRVIVFLFFFFISFFIVIFVRFVIVGVIGR